MYIICKCKQKILIWASTNRFDVCILSTQDAPRKQNCFQIKFNFVMGKGNYILLWNVTFMGTAACISRFYSNVVLYSSEEQNVRCTSLSRGKTILPTQRRWHLDGGNSPQVSSRNTKGTRALNCEMITVGICAACPRPKSGPQLRREKPSAAGGPQRPRIGWAES